MWILLRNENGDVRKVQEGVPYRMQPGEQVIGSAQDETERELAQELSVRQVPLGEFVEAAIKLIPEAIRPKHCSACEKRKQVMNRVRELGVLETIKQVLAVKE